MGCCRMDVFLTLIGGHLHPKNIARKGLQVKFEGLKSSREEKLIEKWYKGEAPTPT